jgi:hypothetical protein
VYQYKAPLIVSLKSDLVGNTVTRVRIGFVES